MYIMLVINYNHVITEQNGELGKTSGKKKMMIVD